MGPFSFELFRTGAVTAAPGEVPGRSDRRGHALEEREVSDLVRLQLDPIGKIDRKSVV